MNLQPIFDRVWRHFVIEEQPASLDLDGGCSYRGPSGERCAVGCLIPDDLYEPAMEGTTVTELLAGYPAVFEVIAQMAEPQGTTSCLTAFLFDLQAAHDDSAVGEDRPFNDAISKRLRDIARIYDLTVEGDNAAAS